MKVINCKKSVDTTTPAPEGKWMLDIGCGEHPRPGYIHMDLRALPHVEIVGNAEKLSEKNFTLDAPYPVNFLLDGIYSSNTLEHFSWRIVDNVLKNWASNIKSGGTIELKVPCQKSVSRAYYEGRINARQFSNATYADQGYPEDFHACAFDPEWLTELLEDAGFKDIEVTDEYKDELGELQGFLIQGVKI